MSVLELTQPLNSHDKNVSPYDTNTNLTTDPTPCQGIKCYPDVVFHTATGITVVLTVFGTVGNILTVLAILTSRLRNNINSILICNLSIADALAFYNRDWIFHDTLCELQGALRIWLIGVNMLLLSGIAFYRFLHVVHPQSQSRYSKTGWFVSVCIVCWALPFVVCICPVAGWWGSVHFEERILQCTFDSTTDKAYKITTITTGYFVPCTFICVCYARIGCVVFGSRQKTSRGSLYRKQKARRESFRLTGMMALIFFGFLVGTTPFFIINTVDSKLRYPMPHIWAPFLSWTMYGLNPIIYTVMDTNFQRAYHRLLLCKIFKQDTTNEVSIQDRKSSVISAKNGKSNP
ncbi:unnamed protein product [Candidula unifasciata]|uniref:G-protein coupled receptors family 1 profile domain-containing protein n=1 Tax=Candidula unifasciata TaxID=100452 RepID=A0A8S3YK38_9EUPU|nr:unnamed protein product [Candidula unifasciata]